MNEFIIVFNFSLIYLRYLLKYMSCQLQLKNSIEDVLKISYLKLNYFETRFL